MRLDSAFSVEISNMISEGSDWNEARPYKFLCGSIATGTAREFGDVHTYWDAETLCDDLYELSERGRLYSWNGVGFDFLALHDSGIALKKALVLNHYDMMFDFFCYHGYPVSLANVLRGLGWGSRADWLGAIDLAQLIADNDRDSITIYSRNKTRYILDVMRKCEDGGGIMWVTKEGKRRMETMEEFHTVADNQNWPVPDTGWMGEIRLTRNDFIGWLERKTE